MNLFKFLPLILIGVFFYIDFGYAQNLDSNPQPLPDDFILPMPNGKTMAFRAVCIGEGSGSYAWKRFRLGDVSGGYKESPTGVVIGGAFPLQQKAGKDWCYYISKYEVCASPCPYPLFSFGRAN